RLLLRESSEARALAEKVERQLLELIEGMVDDRTRPIPITAYPTPEESALAGFDRRYARVVRVRRDQPEPGCGKPLELNEVEVELATNEPPYEYAYFVHVERVGAYWVEGSSHN